MSTYLSFVIIGLGAGAMYAALAMGLVAVHKGTGAINFAQGAMAMYGAYVFDEIRKTGNFVLPLGSLHVGDELATALACGILSSSAIGLAAHLVVFRPLRGAPPVAKVVGSVGLTIALPALVVLRFSSDARRVAPVLPNEVVRWGDVSFSRDRLYLALAAVLIAGVLWGFFRYSRTGLATRAASENEAAAALSGYGPSRLAGVTWVLSSTVVGLMAILAAPSSVLQPTNLTLLVVPALAVALLARLESIPLACVGGLALGSVQSEVTLLTSRPWWPDWASTGLSDAVPFAVIVLALFVFGRRLPSRGAIQTGLLPAVTRPEARPAVTASLAGAGAVALALTGGSYRFALITSMIFAVLALSLVVLTGLAGQLSLAQAALAGTSGFALSKLTTDLSVPFPISMVAAAGTATLLGVMVGIPALRIRGAQLAVVTLAGAVALEQFLFRNAFFVPTGQNLIADPSLFGLNLAVRSGSELVRLPFALFVLAVLVLAATTVGNVARSDTGRALLAVRSNERAAASSGIDVAAVKLLAFGMASFLAGIAGALIGYSRGQLSADSFGVFVSLSLLAAAYLGGISSVGGALLAGVYAPLGIGYVLLDRHVEVGRYYDLLFGAMLIYGAVSNPAGLMGRTRRGRGEGGRGAERGRPSPADPPPTHVAPRVTGVMGGPHGA